MLVALQMGCDGAIGGLHNVCPQMAVEAYEEFKVGDLDRAAELQRVMIEIAEIFQYGAVWGGVRRGNAVPRDLRSSEW